MLESRDTPTTRRVSKALVIDGREKSISSANAARPDGSWQVGGKVVSRTSARAEEWRVLLSTAQKTNDLTTETKSLHLEDSYGNIL
ncbi:MAG: hypothetical protein NTW86_18310, partial [Candidatus Sumerlaeota bacterium]|nr:hypothetical protein [Candidatus Sumerlaeota bacterium]